MIASAMTEVRSSGKGIFRGKGAPVQHSRNPRPPVPRKHIFVLDDDEATVEAVCAALKKARFICSGFTQPRECVERLCKADCDLLLCDMVMPEIDGHRVLAEARRVCPDLPVVLITGHSRTRDVVEVMRMGAMDYLEKPLETTALLETIKEVLKVAEKAGLGTAVKLTKSQRVVLEHIMNGHCNKQIAYLLNRSVRTIEDHRRRLMQKMGVDNLVDLVKRAIELGFSCLSADRNVPA
jgi:two-component system, LuxR family, response regulator FixJ